MLSPLNLLQWGKVRCKKGLQIKDGLLSLPWIVDTLSQMKRDIGMQLANQELMRPECKGLGYKSSICKPVIAFDLPIFHGWAILAGLRRVCQVFK